MESFDNAGLESMTVTLFEQAATEDVKHIEEIVNSVRDYMIALNDAIVRLIPDQVLTGWSLDLLDNWKKCYNGSIQDVKHYHMHVIPKYSTENELISVEDVFNKLTK